MVDLSVHLSLNSEISVFVGRDGRRGHTHGDTHPSKQVTQIMDGGI